MKSSDRINDIFFSMLLLLSADFSKINFFQKKSFKNTILVSNGLDPNQDRRFVGSYLDPNCLQNLVISRRQKSSLARTELMLILNDN